MTLFYRNIVKQQTSTPGVGHVSLISNSYCNADLQTGLQAKPCPVRSGGISDELCSGPVQSCCVAGTSSLSTAGISSRPPPVLHCHSSSLESVSPRIWIWSRLLSPVWIDDDKHYKQLTQPFCVRPKLHMKSKQTSHWTVRVFWLPAPRRLPRKSDCSQCCPVHTSAKHERKEEDVSKQKWKQFFNSSNVKKVKQAVLENYLK